MDRSCQIGQRVNGGERFAWTSTRSKPHGGRSQSSAQGPEPNGDGAKSIRSKADFKTGIADVRSSDHPNDDTAAQSRHTSGSLQAVPIAERRPQHRGGAQQKTAAEHVTDAVPRRADKATNDALAALRHAEQQRGRQGRLPRHLSYRRGAR